MQIHPTRAAVDVGIAGVLGVAVGLIVQQAAIVAWSGALLVGLAIARAVTQVGVARIRAAGFEMLWHSEPRVRRIARGEVVELEAEVRNRDTRAARYVELRPVHSPNLQVEIEPQRGEVAAGGRLRAKVKVRAPRVGHHGIHGLSLEVQGGPGLFEVPLTFSNPFGLEVLPHAYGVAMRSPRGGRSRMMAEAGRPGPLSGEGTELRELREHQAGDPFKRIAWKASARRGRLMVRDYEREERDLVWLVLDASVELWSGTPGTAPLDLAIDEVASVAQRHLARGDRVGLAIVGARLLSKIQPDRGPAHGIHLLTELSRATACDAADRSDLDETDVAVRVIEHMRPLDPQAAHKLRTRDLDRVARRAERVRARAPFPKIKAWAATPREQLLRSYLAAFGIANPPRLEPERPRTDQTLVELLAQLRKERPRPSVIYVWSPAPDRHSRVELQDALAKHPGRRIELRWVDMRVEPSVADLAGIRGAAVRDATYVTARIARDRGAAALKRLGVRVERLR